MSRVELILIQGCEQLGSIRYLKSQNSKAKKKKLSHFKLVI